jgi:glycosyltransferase involved in cell wall biosynthesis
MGNLPKIKCAFITTDARGQVGGQDHPEPIFGTAPSALLGGFAGCPDVEIHVVSCTQEVVRSPEKLAGNIFFHSLHVPKTGWMRTLYQGCIRATRKKIREINPDLVHGHGTERDCAISAALSGYPNVVTIHGNMAQIGRLNRANIGSYHWLAARLENFALRRTLGVLCNSTYTEGLVRPRARKTWLVPHALRLEYLDPPPDPGARPPVLLNVGNITPRKRQLELLDLAEKLHRRGLKFELRFVGFISSVADSYTRAFLERIKPMEAAGCVRFLESLPDDELLRCYNSAAGMVHFPTEEAFGNVVVESLGRDLKFFGSRVGGIVDIAADAPGAELFEQDDWTGLADAIERWIKEGCPRPQGAAALIRERYHPAVIARRHLEIYREVLNARLGKQETT